MRFAAAALHCLAFCVAACLQVPAQADEPPVEQVQVTAPFIELHTGPGRGFPIHYVAARDEWITIELRHTDWFKVRTANGRVGWVEREQLESTLTAGGAKKSFRDVLIDDYLRRRLDFGAAWGSFSSEPMMKLWAGYRFSDTLSVEATAAQVQGQFSGTNLWSLNMLAEPWSDKRFSPFVGIGVGRFYNLPNASLVDAIATDSNLANATIGARYHLGDRFVVRLDYTLYTTYLSDTRTSEYWAVTGGLSFFF
jgi:hypothetical protein